MRYLIRLLAVAVVLAAAVGCAANFEKKLQGWMGSDVNALMANWGPPSERFDMPNGNTMYTWTRAGAPGAVVTQYGASTVATSVQQWCKVTMTADSAGRLQTWRWEGNACR